MKLLMLAALLAALAGCAKTATRPESDWERDNRDRLARESEERLALPPYPKKEHLVEFYVSAATDFKYYIDTSTLSVSPRSREIRYVMVARSPSGAENVSYEAIRCPSEYRVLAAGRPNGTWSDRPSEWREMTKGTSLGWPYALSRNYFCPHRDSVQSVAEATDALQRGSHPAVFVDPRSMPAGSN